jgi:hypothetical protein
MQRKIPVVIIHAMFAMMPPIGAFPRVEPGAARRALCFLAELSLPEGVFSGHGVVGIKWCTPESYLVAPLYAG